MISMRTSIGKVATLVALALSVSACQKDDTAPSSTPGTIDMSPKMASVPVFQMNNGSGTRSMKVASGCNGSIGTINLPPALYQSLKDASSTASVLKVNGFHNGTCSSPMPLNAGSTPGALGPLYYIIPNQGGASYSARAMLKLWVKNSSWPNNHNGAFFTYNVSNNTWTPSNDAGSYFTWQVITGSALPQFTCVYQPCGGNPD